MNEAQPPFDPPEKDAVRPRERGRAETMDAEETGHGSFPASDPPAVWTWEVKSGQGEGGERR